MTPAEELREAAKRLEKDAARLMGVADLVLGGNFLAAVADWLDRVGDKRYCAGPAEFDHALAIARAYLAPVLRDAQGPQGDSL